MTAGTMQALEELKELASTPNSSAVREWKEKGGKVVGIMCAYIPEEILHAGGILSHRVDPTGCTEVTEADGIMSRLNCTYARSCLQFTLEGVYEFLDGVVCMNSCDHMRRLYDIWKYRESFPFIHFISVPHRISESGIKWYHDELNMFRDAVETAFNVKITDEALRKSIKLHNRTRALLKELYELRAGEKPLLTGREMISVMVASMRTPKEKLNQLLEQLIKEAKARGGVSGFQSRVMITGGACDDPEFVGLIEDLGGLVVTDTLCFGSRYCWRPVEEGIDPMLALATAYLRAPSCARMAGDEPARLQMIMDMAKEFKVDGMVFQRLRWCDLWGHDGFYLSEKLRDTGFPMLFLEREYWLSGTEQLKTRFQAFLEVLAK